MSSYSEDLWSENEPIDRNITQLNWALDNAQKKEADLTQELGYFRRREADLTQELNHAYEREFIRTLELINADKKVHGFFNQTLQVDKDNEATEEDKTCIICTVNSVAVGLVPCGHAVMCMTCTTELLKEDPRCPACRKAINGTLQIFL
jgi:hypothetical protein